MCLSEPSDKPRWKAPLPFYTLNCPPHGIVEDYPHARHLEQTPYVKDLVKRLRRNPYLRKACGYQDKATFTQMKIRFGADGFQRAQLHVRLLQFI